MIKTPLRLKQCQHLSFSLQDSSSYSANLHGVGGGIAVGMQWSGTIGCPFPAVVVQSGKKKIPTIPRR